MKNRLPRKKKKALKKLKFLEWMLNPNNIVIKTTRRTGKHPFYIIGADPYEAE